MTQQPFLRIFRLTLLGASLFALSGAQAGQPSTTTPHAFVYTELQISVPFEQVPWRRINNTIKDHPGFLNKTWLAGLGNQSAGGFYAFDSIEHAQQFVTGYFPQEARAFGVAQTTRVFDADATEKASKDMNSVHYQGKVSQQPGAYVYTELQTQAIPFDAKVRWQEIDNDLKNQPGLLAKTWLSGLHTGTPGGFYAFDTIEHAQQFAVDTFPKRAAQMNVAFYTRVFDASKTEAASRDMVSPYYQ